MPHRSGREKPRWLQSRGVSFCAPRYNAPMSRIPRWLRFRLSTVLILTAIAAWGMACRPYIIRTTDLFFTPPGKSPRVISTFAGFYGDPGSDEWLQAGAKIPQTSPGNYAITPRILPNPRLIWPGLASVAFLTWKAGWAIAARRRARRDASAVLS